jgi:hypothetical protein
MLKLAARRGRAKSGQRTVRLRKRGERNELGWAGDRRIDEAVEIRFRGAHDEIGKWLGVPLVGLRERTQVGTPVALEDNRRRIPEADEQQIRQQSPDTSVAVLEWVDSFELGVTFR